MTCRLELRQLLASWEAELGRHAPALAVLHVPRLWAADSAPDIAALFPARTAVVTCMESLLGAQSNLGRTELQALLFSDDLRFRYLYHLSYIPFIFIRDDVSLTYFITKEYDNGSCKTSHVDGGVSEDAETGAGVARRMAQHSGLCLSFEVTNEMKTKESCFSRSNVASVYGINFVTNSYIPRHIFKTGKKIEGLRKIRKVV